MSLLLNMISMYPASAWREQPAACIDGMLSTASGRALDEIGVALGFERRRYQTSPGSHLLYGSYGIRYESDKAFRERMMPGSHESEPSPPPDFNHPNCRCTPSYSAEEAAIRAWHKKHFG